MNFIKKKYKNINIVSTDDTDASFLIDAIKLIEKTDDKYSIYYKYLENIIVGKYHEGDAVAASFVEEKTIILTPYDTNNIDLIASIIIHELTHIYHYHTKPEEYSDQMKAEILAFKNEVDFLQKINSKKLIQESIKIRDNFLLFLKEHEKTSHVDESKLKNADVNMSYHQKIIDCYFKKR